ncbi:MAG: ADOP family duplicated permease, partial [Bryobacteraceae bacterium]
MPRIPIWRRYLRFWGPDIASDVDAELLFHIDEKIRELAATGLSPKEARREALRQFGSVGAVRRECEQIGKRHQIKAERKRYLADWWQDIQYALRMLRKNPGFTAVAILSLALGLGANTAIFSVVNAVLLRPLPYPESGRLVWVAISFPSFHGDEMMTDVDYAEWSLHNHTFSGIAAYGQHSCVVTGGASPESIHCGFATQNLLPILRVEPILGRDFIPPEDKPGGPKVAILGYGLWQRRFGGDRGVAGKPITIDGEIRTIVGVMPRGFRFPGGGIVDVLAPQQLDTAEQVLRQRMLIVHSVGRLKPGVSPAAARADLDVLLSRTTKRFPLFYRKESRVRVVPLQEHEVANVRLTLLVLLGAVGCLLLIACANVANLLLARSAARQREIAVRSAIGASRGRLLRQLLTEAALLGIIGGSAGLLLAGIAVRAFIHFAPDYLPRADRVSIDGHVLLFTFVISLITGIVFGLAPAIHAGRSGVNESLKAGAGRGHIASGLRLRGGLVVAELALSLTLLMGAALLIQSLSRLENVRLGFEPGHLLTTDIKINGQSARPGSWRDVLDGIARIPGVQDVALADGLPPENWYMSQFFSPSDRPRFKRGHRGDSVVVRPVSAGYFRAMGIPLRQGRLFEEGDRQGAPLVTIVNETLVHRYFPNENPIGMRILGQVDHDWRTIVGVVSDSKNRGLESAVEPEAYEPYSQVGAIRSMSLIVRTSVKPQYLIPVLRDQIRAVNRDVPLTFQTMEDNLSGLVAKPRFNTVLF